MIWLEEEEEDEDQSAGNREEVEDLEGIRGEEIGRGFFGCGQKSKWCKGKMKEEVERVGKGAIWVGFLGCEGRKIFGVWLGLG